MVKSEYFSDIEDMACDGEAWEIEYYDPDCRILNSSGDAGYIYGEKCLEKIISLLPGENMVSHANSFISVSGEK